MDDHRPRPLLRGERVFLRPAEREDIPTFISWLSGADVGEGLATRAPWSRVADFNARAIHVHEGVGFRHEGTKREAFYHNGRHHDMHVMGILRPEWEAQERPRSWELR